MSPRMTPSSGKKSAQVFLIPAWLLKEENEQSTAAFFACLDDASRAQQALLLEGVSAGSLQQSAYMGRASESVKTLKQDVGHTD